MNTEKLTKILKETVGERVDIYIKPNYALKEISIKDCINMGVFEGEVFLKVKIPNYLKVAYPKGHILEIDIDDIVRIAFY